MTIKKTGAVTASVANTAKRVIVMIVSAYGDHSNPNPNPNPNRQDRLCLR